MRIINWRRVKEMILPYFYVGRIHLEGLEKTMKELNQRGQISDWGLLKS
jgi:hypothetical protein